MAVVLGMVAAGWVIVPLVLRRRALLGDASPAGLADAEARRSVALASLKEVEYDRASGKLDDEDYHKLKAQLEREALAAISAAAPGAPAPSAPPPAPPVPGPIVHVCGFVNPPGSRFCSGCGQRLS